MVIERNMKSNTFPLLRVLACGLLLAVLFSVALAAQDRFMVQPGDVLEITYRYTPEFNQTVSVQPDGFVTIYLAGPIQVGGKTIDEIQQQLLHAVSNRLRDAELTVTVKDFEKPHFVVTGEVTTPGKYPLHGDVRVLEGIAMAGGIKTQSAKHSQVLLLRRIDHENARTIEVNLKKL